ncbi:hypothetical protein [Raoultella ornithinolytica]|uniref:hypothetical protein n=1 Tax=Raoultella ornithinolytica TaxID=54291 RepID=UPI001EF9625B|nr:hypothetical protein [Raoultella ornithinolytica]
MKERGMIFNGEMVRALLDGRKTQTRRPIKWRQTRATEIAEREDGSKWPWSEDEENVCDYWHPCPFGAVGDRIWVRETWAILGNEDGCCIDWEEKLCKADERSAARIYRASCEQRPGNYGLWSIPDDADWKPHTKDYQYEGAWRPSIHMPRWASRILLEITDVRVERLNAISEEDAQREGVHTEVWDQTVVARNYAAIDEFFQFWSEDMPHYVEMNQLHQSSFRSLWESIYGEDSWKANPWVWVIEFKRCDCEH